MSDPVYTGWPKTKTFPTLRRYFQEVFLHMKVIFCRVYWTSNVEHVWWISSVSVDIFSCYSCSNRHGNKKYFLPAFYWNTWAKGPPAAWTTAFSFRFDCTTLFLIVSSDILSHVARMSIGHFQRWALTDSLTSLNPRGAGGLILPPPPPGYWQ